MGGEVSVRLLGVLGRVAGERERAVTVDDGTTVLDLLTTLASTYGARFASAVFRAPREVHSHVRVFLGDEVAEMTDRVRRPGGDPAAVRVLVVPGFEGGSR